MIVRNLLLSGTALLALAIPMAAAAQDAPVSADTDAESPEIVVSGSRIVRNGNDAPTPVTVITSEEIERAAPTTKADYINQLPALQGSSTVRSSQGGTAAFVGGSVLNLRSLGTARTLTLLNGRRVTPSTLTGAVDLNTLPMALLQRVDIVTGGASAAWGSDAVAGIVNLVLDTKFTGIKGSIQSGISELGDAGNFTAELSVGTSFAGGRGHVILSGNYSKSEVAYLGERDWYKGYKIFANPAFVAGNGQPARLILPNSSTLVTDYGLITTGPLRGTAFDANGQVATTAYPFGPVISGTFQSGGPSGDVLGLSILVTPLETGTGYGRVSFDVADGITVFGEGSYGESSTYSLGALLRRSTADTIQRDNVFLPDSVRTRMVTAGVTTIASFSNKTRLGIAGQQLDRQGLRGLAGIEGDTAGWKWSASYQHGRTRIINQAFNDFKTPNYLLAIDSVAGVNGQPICRSTLTAPTNGCVPLNPFGASELTTAQRDYLIGTARQRQLIEQSVGEAHIQGSPFATWAGDVSIATGVEYRKESARATADARSLAAGFFINYGAFKGSFDVKEGFFETIVPLLKDSSLGKSLELNGAVRYTDYSESGGATTWKVGATYEPVDGLAFRVTRSRDIRAPNLNELFLGTSITNIAVADPFNGGASVQFSQLASGSRNLKPEIAQSLTGGVIYRPSWFRGLSFSVDYYDIKIADAITTTTAQQIVTQCYAGNQVFCGAITRNAAGTITTIGVTPFNAASESARGIDTEIGYRSALGDGNLDLRLLVNYTDKLEIVSPSGLVTTKAGELGNNLGSAQGVPHFTGYATVGYSSEGSAFQLKGRFIGGGKMEVDYGPLDVNRNDVNGIFYLDAFAGVNVKTGKTTAQFFVAVDNLLDRDPPVVVNQDAINGQNAGTNMSVYDTIGRAYRVGVRIKL